MESPEPGMRLHMARFENMKENVIFIHDAIFVDTRRSQKSYLLDYGRVQTNQRIEQYISQYIAHDRVFHVFTYPEKLVRLQVLLHVRLMRSWFSHSG